MTTAAAYKTITLADLKAKLDKKEPFKLWNVLTKEYYKADKNIPGSKWFPADTLTREIAEKNAKKDETVVTYCGGVKCPSSRQAAEKLVSVGYTKVYAFEGGLEEWIGAGYPVVSL
jgi:rhodanese-related sulfurtransferase